MSSDTILGSFRQVGKFLGRNGPTIFTFLSAGGVIITIGMSIDATIKSMNLISEENTRRIHESAHEGKGLMPVPLTKTDYIRLCWKEFAPTALMGMLTIGGIIAANSINLRRNAALTAVYSISQEALREYRAKVVETLGERKEGRMRDDIMQDRLNAHPITDDSQVLITGLGNTLCFDCQSARYFRSDPEKIRQIINDLNFHLMSRMYMTLNEFYDDLHLEHTRQGDIVGWTAESGMMEVRYTSKVSTNLQPCLVLDYEVWPIK